MQLLFESISLSRDGCHTSMPKIQTGTWLYAWRYDAMALSVQNQNCQKWPSNGDWARRNHSKLLVIKPGSLFYCVGQLIAPGQGSFKGWVTSIQPVRNLSDFVTSEKRAKCEGTATCPLWVFSLRYLVKPKHTKLMIFFITVETIHVGILLYLGSRAS